MSDLLVPLVTANVWEHHVPGQPFVAAIVEEVIRAPDLDDKSTWYSEPPAWLVALRDARCETPYNELCANPRCVDGRLLHDVQVECDRSAWRVKPDHCHGCENCDVGYRTVRCLVDVVPVVGPHEPRPSRALRYATPLGSSAMEPQWLLIDGTHDPKVKRLTPDHVEALAAACGKPPAEWPGMYAVIVNVA